VTVQAIAYAGEDGDGEALDPVIQPQCSLAVQLRRAPGPVIGRTIELEAISQELTEATHRLAAMTLEGEPGIGKTRLLLAAAERAAVQGFTVCPITADEEIRGPFLLARSLFAAPAIRETAAGTPAEAAVRRAVEAISGRDEPGLETLSPDAKLLRAFDLAGVAAAALADIRPLALLIDDVQWADDDTLRLLRYVVRADSDRRIFLFLTIRPDEMATVTEAVNFVADMERMGLVRRVRPARFSSVETAELLKRVLGAAVEATSATAMHAQAEGVPFIAEELAQAHRQAGTLQLVDGEWRLGRNAARLLPAAVRTLIDRRATRLPAPTKAAMGDAAILGRSFSLRDLRAVRARIADGAEEGDTLADDLAPAVGVGLLLPQPPGGAADFTFTHEQVREFAAAELSASRRRQVHAAIVDLLLEGGDPAPASLPMLAQHALAAGDTVRAAHLSIDAATSALASNAPEEALRLVEEALPVVSAPADRRILLATRDDAYAALRRTGERLEGLAELAALAEAMRDPKVELDVQLRRASALRMSRDEDAAAELARRVRSRAAQQGDDALELRATLELGQALLRTPIGESFGGVATEIDLDGAEEAYRRAIELAEGLKDDRSLAAALRELGMIDFARARSWFASETLAGHLEEVIARVAAGESLEAMILASPIGPHYVEAGEVLNRALEIFERLGDRTGVMSTVIAMAYANYGVVIHLSNSARHLEEIRRVTSRLSELVTESERARLELQMLFGTHVYARAKVVPDLALSRGEEAHRAAKLLGDRAIEFPGCRRCRDDAPGARRPRGRRALARSGRGGRVVGGVADTSARAGDVARDRPCPCRRRAGNARPVRSGARVGDGVRARRGSLRGPRPVCPRDGGAPPANGRDGRRPAATRCRARRSRRGRGEPGEGPAAAPSGSRPMGRPGGCRAREPRAHPRQCRRCGRTGGRRDPGAPGCPPRGHEPGHRPAGRASHPGRRSARGAAGPARLSAADALEDRPGHGRRGDPGPVAEGAGRARACRAVRRVRARNRDRSSGCGDGHRRRPEPR
jgi:tetratricopeptide (TPR) repeat protein